MLKKFMKTALVAMGLMFGAAGAQSASVDSAQLALEATDGITAFVENGHWKLASTTFNVHGSVSVVMSTGSIHGFAIYNGACGALCPNGIGYKKLFFDAHPLVDNPFVTNISFDVSTDDYPQGLTQNLEAQKIFQACTDRTRGSFHNSDVTFTHSMKVTLSLDFTGEKGPGFNVAQVVNHDWWDDFSVPVEVTCKPEDQPQMPGGITHNMGEFRTTGIDLFLSTFSNAVSQPNPATTCKKARVLVRVKTSKAGPAKFKLWTRVGNGPLTSKVVDAWSSHDGNGGFNAEHTEWISVDHPTPVQAMAEDMVNAVGQTTQWKNITLQCTGAGGNGGGGGFTVDNDTGNPDNDFPKGKTLKGDFAFVDQGSPKCSRTGKALVTFTSPKADNIHWSLDCKFSSKSGVLATQPRPQGDYMAATMVPIDVNTTMDESCTLRTVAPYGPKDHVSKDHLFQCVNTSGHAASGDLKPETRDEPQTNGRTKRNPLGQVVVPPAANDARKKAEEAAKLKRKREAAKKAAELKRKREAAKKAAELKRKREAAKKAAELKRKGEAAKKAAELKRKREAAKKAAELKRKRKAAAAKRKRKKAEQDQPAQ